MRERRMSKYILSIVLALAMVIGIAVFAIPTASADPIEPSDSLAGSGTESDPYLIGSVADWLYFANLVNGTTQDKDGDKIDLGYFQLSEDITFNEGDASTWGSSAPAINLANYGGVNYIVGHTCNVNPFVGTFDGNGHTISGVYIMKNDSSGSVGLFGSTAAGETATIKNLIITNSYYESDGQGEAGALIGQTSGGETYIDTVFVTDSVYIKSAGTSNGGFIGHNGGNGYGTPTIYIDNSVNGATVDAGSQQYVGGFIGNGNGNPLYINNCLNYGTIKGGTNYLAGFVGRDDKAGSEINNSVNIGTVTPTSGSNYRQFIMSNSSSKKPILNNCLSITNAYGKNTTNNDCAQINKDAFLTAGFLSTANGQKLGDDWTELAYVTSISGGTRTVTEICAPAALVDLFGSDVIRTNLYKSVDSFPAPQWILDAWNDGTVTITSAQEWKEFANFMNGVYSDDCTDNMNGKTVLLDDDIDFGGEDLTAYIIGVPAANAFKGTFDGQGHTISGVYMYKSAADGDTVGLFGFSAAGEEATFQNLLITDSYFESEAGAVAALLAQTAGGVTNINNIYVTDTVEIVSGDSYSGGIAAHNGANGFGNPQIYIDSCVNAATVTSDGSAAGGILGNGNGQVHSVTNCLNMGDITGSKSVGGIVGYGRANAGIEINIECCVNVGVITSASSTNVEKACAISSMGTTARDTLTSYGCYYLAGTATYGVFEGSGESADGGSEGVAISVLIGAALPTKLDESGAWIARGDGSVCELCIPFAVVGFAPAETKYRVDDNTPDEFKDYENTDEFEISTVDEWKLFANFVNGVYTTSGNFNEKTVKLTADLDFEGEDITEWMVGNAAGKSFKGTFDGQGHTITGVQMYKSEDDGDTVGLFGFAAAGEYAFFKNLIIKDSRFESAKGAVGALIAQTAGGCVIVENVYVDADVEIYAEDAYIGGLVGHIGGNGYNFIDGEPAISFDSCVNAATVTGETEDNTKTTCVGGILGNANNKYVVITNSLNLGAITGYNNVGGILGNGTGTTKDIVITVDACVNIGTVVASKDGGNGAAIANLSTTSNTRTATDCYYLIGSATSGVVSGYNTDVQAVAFAELGGATLPENLNSDFWLARGEGDTLEICIPAAVEAYAPAETSFRTTDNTPNWLKNYANTNTFTIVTVTQWKELARFIKGEYMRSGDFEGKKVQLGKSINFNNEDMTEYMLGSMASPFAGTFDGKGNTISGFSVIVEGADTAGIFGSTAGGKTATIKNLVIANSHFEANGAVGALIGQTSGGSTIVENVYVTATVEIVSTGNYVGGLVGHVGQNGYNFITDEPALSVNACVNAANITTTASDVGGILGNSNTKVVVIANCLNVGDITGYRYVGGIVGLASDTVEISYCINAGDINGTSSKNYFADIATGNVNANREVTISNCYYTDIKSAFVSESDLGTVNLEDNTPYFAIPTVDWDGWTAVDGGLPTPFAIADVLTVSENIDRSVILTGASVRMDTPTGIRFTAQFSKGFIDSLDNTAKIGIMITPKAYLDEAGEFTYEALKALSDSIGKQTYVAVYNFKNVEGCFASDTDEYYVFNAVLANIKAENYTRDFCARAFIELEDGTILYSDYNDTNNKRNVAAVAEAAYNDTKTLDENEGIAGYMYFVEEIEVEVKEGEDVTMVTKYVYSPYTAEQRDVLASFLNE